MDPNEAINWQTIVTTFFLTCFPMNVKLGEIVFCKGAFKMYILGNYYFLFLF